MGRWLERLGLVAVLVAFGAILWQSSRASAASLELAAVRDTLATLRPVTDSLRAELDRQLPEVERLVTVWRDRWRESVRWDTLAATDTVWVPVEILVSADSAINACSAALGTCAALADSLTRARDLADREVALVERRPWTAAGISASAADGTLGAFVDRDYGRFRLGASAGPARAGGVRGEVRVGVRW